MGLCNDLQCDSSTSAMVASPAWPPPVAGSGLKGETCSSMLKDAPAPPPPPPPRSLRGLQGAGRGSRGHQHTRVQCAQTGWGNIPASPDSSRAQSASSMPAAIQAQCWQACLHDTGHHSNTAAAHLTPGASDNPVLPAPAGPPGPGQAPGTEPGPQQSRPGARYCQR